MHIHALIPRTTTVTLVVHECRRFKSCLCDHVNVIVGEFENVHLYVIHDSIPTPNDCSLCTVGRTNTQALSL